MKISSLSLLFVLILLSQGLMSCGKKTSASSGASDALPTDLQFAQPQGVQ